MKPNSITGAGLEEGDPPMLLRLDSLGESCQSCRLGCRPPRSGEQACPLLKRPSPEGTAGGQKTQTAP